MTPNKKSRAERLAEEFCKGYPADKHIYVEQGFKEGFTAAEERARKLVEAMRVADNYLMGGKEWTYSEYEHVRDRVSAALKDWEDGK